MPPKTKASERKTVNKANNAAVQKRSARGGKQAAEIKKGAKAQKSESTKKGKAVKEVVEEEQSAEENDEELMTEEQEEALRKEILGDMESDDEESDDEEEEKDDQETSGDAFNSAEDVISLDPEQVKKSKEETKAKFDKKKKAPVNTVSCARELNINIGAE